MNNQKVLDNLRFTGRHLRRTIEELDGTINAAMLGMLQERTEKALKKVDEALDEFIVNQAPNESDPYFDKMYNEFIDIWGFEICDSSKHPEYVEQFISELDALLSHHNVPEVTDEDEVSRTIMHATDGKKCKFCKEPIDNYAANPSKWGMPLPFHDTQAHCACIENKLWPTEGHKVNDLYR